MGQQPRPRYYVEEKRTQKRQTIYLICDREAVMAPLGSRFNKQQAQDLVDQLNRDDRVPCGGSA